MPTPDTLRWAAGELRREAAELIPTINGFIDVLGPTVWSGRKADEARSELESERTVLGIAALELESLAAELEQQAQHAEAFEAQQARARAEAEQQAAAPLASSSDLAVHYGAHYVG